MIEINLLPEHLKKREVVQLALPEVPIKGTLIWIFSVLVGLLILFTIFTFYQKTLLSRIAAETATFERSTSEITRRKKDTLIIMKRLNQAKSLVLTRRDKDIGHLKDAKLLGILHMTHENDLSF